ncbi:hypothetical protein GIY56_04305 [Paracoccus sp. YIM 132242]|uniref:Uncharacterized protein n=1 Tax=Paracoccus lichenicola TaxID=2665644 RepID=A0A6L6HJX3_9RHOB|nr:hypothetical protein [Paracoccus lichenicola]MTD99506.1 hypothetical protein [Paracoccus lichenicola]
MERYGLDKRFSRFVVWTMFWTVICGLFLIALHAVFADHPDSGIGLAIIYLVFGGIYAASCALIAFGTWFLPSVIVFGRVFRRLRRRFRDRTAAMIAGIVTALVGSIAFYVIGTLIGRDFDGIHALIILFGPVSLFVAPVVAWWVYRRNASQPFQETA